MKVTKSGKFKLVVWAFVLICMVAFMVQNQEFFKQKQSYHINLIHISAVAETGWKAFQDISSPELPHALIFFLSFALGIGVTYTLGFFGWFKSKRTIKSLSNDCDRLYDKVKDLEGELAPYKNQQSGFGGGDTTSEEGLV